MALAVGFLALRGKVGADWPNRKQRTYVALGFGGTLVLVGAAGWFVEHQTEAAQQAQQSKAAEQAKVAQEQAAAQQAAEEQRQQRLHDDRVKQATQAAIYIVEHASELQSALSSVERSIERNKFDDASRTHRAVASHFIAIEGADFGDPDTLTGDAVERVTLVNELRSRFRKNQATLVRKENEVFDATFEALWDPANGDANEDRLMKKVARSKRVPVEYVKDVYVRRADEAEKRLAARR